MKLILYLKDFIIYNYKKTKRKFFNIYIYKEKKYYYIETINLKYIKLKEKYLNTFTRDPHTLNFLNIIHEMKCTI